MNKVTTERNIVGRRVAEARARISPPITQDGLSGRLALAGLLLDRAAIAKIERNHRRVLDFEVKALAQALGVSGAVDLGRPRAA